ncbi:MerR family transcriptional regulator [Streptomyces tagetis]|uniref:MerR family transcriptional regulator n=1 Tax=Streptomyces tagetis TaxID=2820809 RepID=A0A941B5F8_9ACTN|nr:MerR family transcriptional regulator [Streptomyces sp. RG38]MBQ0830217.1 MerR family transcriptional regulator [Streptomyces sp. RG38]
MREDLLPIGAFARACGLSPKALRLYDSLGLLRPARVDPVTGYRYYAAGQLESARLVVWLRRLDMPLAGIREVCALGPAAAAREIGAHWARVEAETALRRDLAAFLIAHLTREPAHGPGKDDLTMTELRHHAHSDTGRVRPANQDAAYAGGRLLAVADGFGPAGASASSAAVQALRFLDDGEPPADGVLDLLEEAVRAAAEAVRDAASGAGEAGTTLTALLWTGSRLALTHIGDTRAYVLRDGGLSLLTRDHTLVQSMVDEGRLTPLEAAADPRRSLLARALTGDGTAARPDLRLYDSLPGDRYLLCSDGLSTVVPEPRLRGLLAAAPDPDRAVTSLIDAAGAAGGPDNVTCVVADAPALAA